MGFNSVLFVCNDALDTVDREPEKFAKLMSRKMGGIDTGEFGFGNHCNGFSIPHIAHADTVALIAVGGNHATRIMVGSYVGNHHTEGGQVELLRNLATKLGYTIRKKTR